MPLQKLQFRPGVNRESTTLANEGTYFEMDKVRFRSGFPEKIGGWVADTGTSDSVLAPPTGSYWGVARSLWNWITLSSYNLLGIGTNLKFYIQSDTGGTFHDITPIRLTTAAGDVTFAATNGSTTLTVTDTSHGAQVGDFVTYSGASSLGGAITALVLNREYRIVSITNNNIYTITSRASAGGFVIGVTYVIASIGTTNFVAIGAASNTVGVVFVATGVGSGTGTASPRANGSDVGNGGASTVGAYQITTGSEIYTGNVGWGAGGWGGITTGFTSTGWGSPAPSGVGIGVQLRLWSQSNYGENLIFNPRGGGLYYWDTNVNPNIYDRGTLLTAGDTPDICNYVTVSDASRFVIGFGVNDYGSATQNPMLVRWSDQEDFTQWTPAVTNQAGSYTLSHGSQIITVLQSRQELLVWTDAALYSMQYLGPPYVWGFQLLADNLSIVSPNATATASNTVYWMGVDKFYSYSGRVETLYCPLRQYIYGNINLSQSFQVFAGTNEGYNEIWWYYCSASSTTVDRYVIYNYLEKVWSYGNLARTAWLDSPLRSQPLATTYGNKVVYHETGVDDGTTNPPSPISSYIQSADFNIGDGHNYGFVWRMIPDITFDGSTNVNNPSVTFTTRPRQNPGANYDTALTPAVTSTQNYQGQQSYNVQQFTQIIYTRVRGRQMAFKVSSDGLGVKWQLGVPSIDVRPDGRR
jgi:hypothetical protein